MNAKTCACGAPAVVRLKGTHWLLCEKHKHDYDQIFWDTISSGASQKSGTTAIGHLHQKVVTTNVAPPDDHLVHV